MQSGLEEERQGKYVQGAFTETRPLLSPGIRARRAVTQEVARTTGYHAERTGECICHGSAID